MPRKEVGFSFVMSRTDHTQLKKIAEANDLTSAAVIRRAIREYLQRNSAVLSTYDTDLLKAS